MPRSPPGAYESYPSLLFANARPEALFRYRSKAIAFSSLENARYATKRHGLYGSMWRFARVMSFEPRSQFVGRSDAGFAGLNQAFEQTDIFHGDFFVSNRSSPFRLRSSSFGGQVGLRPAAYAAAPLSRLAGRRCAAAKAGGAGGLERTPLRKIPC